MFYAWTRNQQSSPFPYTFLVLLKFIWKLCKNAPFFATESESPAENKGFIIGCVTKLIFYAIMCLFSMRIYY